MARRPSVNTRCVADAYHAANERIVEVFDPTTKVGCLISVRSLSDCEDPAARLAIDVYRADPGVRVTADHHANLETVAAVMDKLAIVVQAAEDFLEDLESGLKAGLYDEGHERVEPLRAAIASLKPPAMFRNHYNCPCGHSWTDDHTATCDDKCEKCNAAIQPTYSEDLPA